MATFPNNCGVRVVNVDSSQGCTLTRASIVGMTPQTFANQNNTETLFSAVIARSIEARATGVSEGLLKSILLGGMRDVKKPLGFSNIPDQGSVILPYHYKRQRKIINSNYWRIVSCAASPAAGTGSVHPGAVDMVIATNAGPWASPLLNIEQYFLLGSYVTVQTVSNVGNASTATTLNYKIVFSQSNNGSTTQAKVTMEPNVTPATWTTWTAAAQAQYVPSQGIVFTLANSVSDYESFNNQYGAENTMKLLTFWHQTTRETFEYNDEYMRALGAIYASAYFHDFKELPLARQKMAQHSKWERDLINSHMYGQPINENQTPETYSQLPPVYDPNLPGCVLEYKANNIGIQPQLANCGRVLDLQGGPFNMDNFLAAAYGLKRYREAEGADVEVIDLMTNRFTAGKLQQLFSTFYKQKYGTDTVRYYEPNQKLMFEKEVAMTYDMYQIPQDMGGFQIAVIADKYFDDKIAAADPALQSRASTVWAIDWSDVHLGVVATNKVMRQTNVNDPLFQTVMKPNVRHYEHNSTTFSTEVDDPNRSLIVDNFDFNAAPVLTVSGVSAN